MLVLFFLFPRIPGPLWGLPDDAFTSQTGLSEEMSPGSINRLINSSAIAFRVKFEQQVPRHNQLYWRGAVLSDYDGRTWRRNDAPASAEANIQYDENPENRFRYTVTLEPTNLSWLLSLEYPKPADGSTHDIKYSLNREAMLLTKDKINNVTNYTIESQAVFIQPRAIRAGKLQELPVAVTAEPQDTSTLQAVTTVISIRCRALYQ